MNNWIEEPTSYKQSDWDEEIRHEYGEYKRMNCFCHLDEDCECILFEDFREKREREKLEDYWNSYEPAEPKLYQL